MHLKDARVLLGKMAGRRVAVIGDVILDRYIWGHASRISPEAPVPVVKVARRTSALGGAANVMRNLAALGVQPLAFGIVGDDADAQEVRALCERWRIDSSGLIADSGRGTTVKIRLVSDNQQVARIDEESNEPLGDSCSAALLAALRAAAAHSLDAIILEDYNKGVVTQSVADAVMALAHEHGIPVALDPHPGNPFRVSGLELMTPNRPEAFAMAGTFMRRGKGGPADDADVVAVGERLCREWQCRHLLITLGSDGMVLFDSEGPPRHIETVAREVFDVSGAGDTVIATFVAATVAGAAPMAAAELANHAAGVVVGKVGTVPVDADALFASYDKAGEPEPRAATTLSRRDTSVDGSQDQS